MLNLSAHYGFAVTALHTMSLHPDDVFHTTSLPTVLQYHLFCIPYDITINRTPYSIRCDIILTSYSIRSCVTVFYMHLRRNKRSIRRLLPRFGNDRQFLPGGVTSVLVDLALLQLQTSCPLRPEIVQIWNWFLVVLMMVECNCDQCEWGWYGHDLGRSGYQWTQTILSCSCSWILPVGLYGDV